MKTLSWPVGMLLVLPLVAMTLIVAIGACFVLIFAALTGNLTLTKK